MENTVIFTVSRDNEFGFRITTKHRSYTKFNMHQVPAVLIYKRMVELVDKLNNNEFSVAVLFEVEK